MRWGWGLTRDALRLTSNKSPLNSKELRGLFTSHLLLFTFYFFTGFDISSLTVLYKLSAFKSLSE